MLVLVAVLSGRKERRGTVRGGRTLRIVGPVRSRASGGGSSVLARVSGASAGKEGSQGTHLLGPEEGSDDPVLCLVDPMRGYDRQRVPLVPLGVRTLACSSRGFELILLILFRADEAVDGCQVGQEQVVPVHELEERRQSLRRRVVLVCGELRLEVRDGVDELDEAKAQRVEVLIPIPVHRSIRSLHRL